LLQLNEETRDLRGSFVTFGNGAEVTSIHISNASSISPERFQLSTVSCSWYKPSKVAWLHYSSSKKAELASDRLRTARINGRIVQAKVINPPHHLVQAKVINPPYHLVHNPIWSVELGNLSGDTTVKDLQANLKDIIPNRIVFGKLSYALSEAEICSIVKSQLLKYGSLESFETSHNLSASRMKALARFTNASHARAAAAALSGTRMTEAGGARLYVNLIASVKFLILRDLYEIVKDDIESLQKLESSVRINIYPPERDGKPVVVRIIGDDMKAVSKVKVAYEALVKGEIILDDDGIPCWDDFMASSAGLAYLRDLNQPGRLFVYRDSRRRRLVVHGSPDSFEAIRQAILVKVKDLSETTHYISLLPDLLRRALTGGFRRMVESMGKQKVKLDITSKPPSIAVQGSTSDIERAKALLLLEGLEPSRAQKLASTEECPACMTEPEQPVSLTCGHSYCNDCFEGQCKAADNATIPISCFGAEGKCGRIITLEELKMGLSSDEFENVLRNSMDTYLQVHQKELQYCPSPDCPTIYSVTSDGKVITCHTCLASICTTCQTINHDGLTCDDSKYMVTNEYKAFQQWKKENDVRDCPRCKTAIEKTYGCNHMECRGCKAHICWFCMDCFGTSKECYGHMHDKHGTYYQ
jgi:IBR domain, a half RING-finger domain/Zinc finger, C3HC4 type (RING finger)